MHDKISNSASKLIKSLQQKKYRDLHRSFVVEGIKLVGEAFAANAPILHTVYSGEAEDFPYPLPENAVKASERELSSISSLKSPNRILAVCNMLESGKDVPTATPIFALDGVADPGNMGTIIRLCDWFGMPHLVCDHRCVDVYNPKVVQATMGSIFRVAVHYVDLPAWLTQLSHDKEVIAADMNGTSIYDASLSGNPVVVLGSEAHGLSPEADALAKQRICIPKVGGGESLNVAISAAIFASALRQMS